MRVTFIIGPCQLGRCGVGDYTLRLAGALQEAGVHVDIVNDGNWRFIWLPSLLRLARRTGADILHLQYPTMGFGSKLGVQGLAMAMPSVVTLHEASKARFLRKLALYPFALRPKHIIFTSHGERAFGIRWAPWVREYSSVIPLGSNIEGMRRDTNRDIREIVYFGLVMPRKGLEDVLALAALFAGDGHGLRVRVVGSHRLEHAAYVEQLRRKSEGLPVFWEQDLSEAEVGRRLARACIAYLPFPDGASERRTTLKAALACGMAVVTTRGPDTPQNYESVVRFAASPSEAYAAIRELVANPADAEELGERAWIFAFRYSWETIAQSHLALYRSLVPKQEGESERMVEEQIRA
jgi:glycosyltransferase involved in cell wall biosynthesis